MRKSIKLVSSIVLVAMCFATGCATDGGGGEGDDMPSDPDDPVDPPPPPPPPPPVGESLTGRWTGTFMTTNGLASKGDFAFDFTEAASHAVTGPFTGTVTEGAAGNAFKGTYTGTRNGTTLTGTVMVIEPAGVTGEFRFSAAMITGGMTIAGNFELDLSYSGLPITGTGSYSIAR